MRHPELMHRMRGLAAAITRNIEAPNWGGCCVIAGMVATELERIGVQAEVVTPAYRVEHTPAWVREHLELDDYGNNYAWENFGLSRSHLAVRFMSKGRLYTWDSDGLIMGGYKFGRDIEYAPHGRYKCVGKFGDGLKPDEAVLLGSDPHAWNSCFDREQIPEIQRLTNIWLGRCPPTIH